MLGVKPAGFARRAPSKNRAASGRRTGRSVGLAHCYTATADVDPDPRAQLSDEKLTLAR
jgi:hypothetical protein